MLDYYHLDLDAAYAIGDSDNDLPMLPYVPNSVAMGNASPASLFDQVSFVTKRASEDGIAYALEQLGFFESRFLYTDTKISADILFIHHADHLLFYAISCLRQVLISSSALLICLK